MQIQELGKSSASYAALSAFCDPNKLHVSLNMTKVALELLLSYCNHFPVAIQERSIVNSEKELQYITYLLGEGVGRGRGNQKLQMREMSTWHNIILLNGEEVMFDEGDVRKGLYTRCIQIEGSPYDYNEKEAKEMYKIVTKQYGTAGRFFVEKLVQEYGQDDYKTLKEKYSELIHVIEEGKNISEDLSLYYDYLAVILLADSLVSEWIFDEDSEEYSLKMIEDVSKCIYIESGEDGIDKCYEYILNWIIANVDSFNRYKKKTDFQKKYKLDMEDDINELENNRNSLGIYEDEKGTFNVFRYLIEDKIKSRGYKYRRTIAEFAKRGYIIPQKHADGSVDNTVQKKYRGINTRFYCFPIEQIESKLSESEQKELDEKLKEIGKPVKIENMDEFLGKNNTDDEELLEILKNKISK